MLITAPSVLPGPAGERIDDGAVLVRDGVIVAAGPRTAVEAMTPPGTERQDFPGATVLPGLINGHVHLALDASADPVGGLAARAPADLLADMTERAAQLLRSGVTTIRDLGDRDGGSLTVRRAIQHGDAIGPRILAAVTPLTPPGGHCWFFGGEVADRPAMLNLVRRNAGAGADVIKVMASGGHITPGAQKMWESQFSRQDLRAVVAEAHELGLSVAAHAHGTPSIADAVAAGVDTVEHCTFLDEQGRAELPADLAAEMADRRIAACCTTGNRDWSTMIAERGEAAAREVFQRYPWLERQGVPLVIGTDAGVSGAPFGDYVGSLELYRWLGFPLDRILELATVDSARGLGLAGVTGRIGPGMSADLLVVDGDPTTDLAALRAVRLVVAAGACHPRQPAGRG